MTTFGYELRLVKDLLPGHLARQWHVPSSILSPRPVPRPTSLVPRPKFNEFSIRPSRALTVWQIQHPARVDGPSLAQLAVVESKMDAHRAQASRTSRSFEEVRAEEQLFAEQAEALAQLQWENPVALFDSVDIDHSGTLALAEPGRRSWHAGCRRRWRSLSCATLTPMMTARSPATNGRWASTRRDCARCRFRWERTLAT